MQMALEQQHLLMLPFLFFLTLLTLPIISTARSYKNISLGSSLTTLQDDSPWTSPSGDFAFGFQQIEEDGFLLAIWFNKIPERTIVWYAAYQPYGSGPNLVGNGSKVELATDGQFLLKDPSGKQIWNAIDDIDHVALLDTGNLVLVGRDSVIRWQSFDHPTDTLLPGQVLLQESGRTSRLVSRYQETNFTDGRFQFALQGDGNLVLYTQNFPQDIANFDYWSTQVLGNNFRWVFKQSGDIFLQFSNGTIIKNISSSGLSTKDFYQRAILENDGVFKHYIYPRSSSSNKGSWSKGWNIITESVTPANICLEIRGQYGGGACGFNSYCTYTDRKRCHCPTGFSFIDPNDVMKGCKQDFVSQSCDESPLLFDLIDMDNTDWVNDELYVGFHSVNEDWCRQACLDDCFCVAATFKDNNCYPKRPPLSNGRQDSSVTAKSFIKIRIDNSTLKPPVVPPITNGSSSNPKLVIIGSVLLSGSGLLIFLFIILIACFAASRQSSKVVEPSQVITDMNLTSYTYEELRTATNGFNEELGQGAFATVYKGVIPGPRVNNNNNNDKLVAVKKLDSKFKEIHEEFIAELSAIGQTNHRNLVQLIGFCDEGEKRLLVYEFMSNGSLASLLFGAQRRPRWYQRKGIAIEIARGLSYLHDECRTQIIHCDIKPQNILLDNSYMARISDFGLAKLLKLDQTRTTTAIRGTKGYVAPEWFRSIPVSVKVDVYSYGILLLELICCRKNFDANAENDDMMILADWAYDSFRDGKVSLLVADDVEALDDVKVVGEFVMTAIWCIQEDPSLRPTMKKVLLMLEGSVHVPIPPNPASLSVTY